MAKVWVVQETPIRDNATGELRRRDLTPALEYGSLEVLLEADERVLNAQPMVEKLRTKLARYTEADFIIPMGDPVAIGIVCALVADMTGGAFTLLKWERQQRRYFPIPVLI